MSSPLRLCCCSFSVSVLNFETSPNSGVKKVFPLFFLAVRLFLGFFSSSAAIARDLKKTGQTCVKLQKQRPLRQSGSQLVRTLL